MKRNKKGLMLLLLGLACTALLVTGTYAAYTKYDFVKWVVSTTATPADLRFSSNYMTDCDMSLENYPERVITAGSSANVTIGLTVCNYPQTDSALVNEADITYTLIAELVNVDDAAAAKITLNQKQFPVTIEGNKLPGGTPSQHLYQLSFPSEVTEALSKGRIRLKAVPSNPDATGNKMLTVSLRIMPSASQAANWTGSITDNLSNPASLDAFNYKISGAKAGTMTLTWSDQVRLSPWSAQELGAAIEGNSITFNVGGQGMPTTYLLQFYRVGGIPADETAASVRSYIQYSFASEN